MPFTPFHMGPGLAVKALLGRRFSVLSFGIAQVAMDIEPLVQMLRDGDRLHGLSHTFVGASVIGLAIVAVAPALCRPILERWNQELAHHRLASFASEETLSRSAVWSGALIGTYSHVVLDAIMHVDAQPFAPWVAANALHGAVSIASLHALCVATGLIGVAAWAIAGLRRRWGAANST